MLHIGRLVDALAKRLRLPAHRGARWLRPGYWSLTMLSVDYLSQRKVGCDSASGPLTSQSCPILFQDDAQRARLG